jgi:hypothetical protein
MTESKEETNPPTPDPENPEETETKKQFTQEELDAIVKERLAREQKKYAELLKAQEAERTQKAELEKLEGIERIKKESELSLKKVAEERDSYLKELRLANARIQLSEHDLPASFAETVLGADDEDTTKKILELSKLVESQVAVKVTGALHKGAPNMPDPPKGDVDPIRDAIRGSMGLK